MKLGNMREQSMFCKLKSILFLMLSVVAMSFLATNSLQAQNVTLESDEMPLLSDDNNGNPDFLGVDENIPNQLSMPEDDSEFNNGMLSPNGKITPQPVDNSTGIDLEETSELPLEGLDLNNPVPLNNVPLSGPNFNPAPSDNSGPTFPSTSASLGSSTKSLVSDTFGEGILSTIDNELFAQMSDLEKQTALLTLELRREKIKNEIEAIKAQRLKGVEEEEAKKEEKERKRIEWEKDQEAKIIREKKELEEATFKLERLRQQNVLRAYKETMLDANQKWIKNSMKLYEQIQNIENDRKSLIENLKTKMAHVSALAVKAQKDAEMAKDNYQREVKNLQTQISILKSRLEAEIAEKKNDKTNPFAQPDVTISTPEETPKLSEEYVIMEIRGKGEKLTAKLINKGGDSFMARKGTVLQTGHLVDEITQTYIRADIGGMKDYLYFSAGGILDKEPAKSDIKQKNKAAAKKADVAKPASTTMTNQGVPSLGSGMFVR